MVAGEMKMSRRKLLGAVSLTVGSGALGNLEAAEKSAPETSSTTPSAKTTANSAVCLADFEVLAKERLSHSAYEYIASGAADEITIRWNREAFDAIRLKSRVLVDIDNIDTRLSLFGQDLAHPILLAPTAWHRLSHPEGEVATARGAGVTGTIFVVSSLSTRKLAEIAPAAKAPLWFQIYDLRKQKRDFVRAVIQEAEANGCRAFVVTADAPVSGVRNRIQRLDLRLPAGVETPYYQKPPEQGASDFPTFMGSFTWEAVEWLRSQTRLPVIIKGIINPDDAELAVRTGAAGIIVSNHGGRCLDTLPATITALGPVAERIAGRIPVLMDGGVRRGTDILKALALGAKAVLIGRPYVYGLAANGAEGVAQVVNILRGELQMAMALAGRTELAAIDKSVLW